MTGKEGLSNFVFRAWYTVQQGVVELVLIPP